MTTEQTKIEQLKGYLNQLDKEKIITLYVQELEKAKEQKADLTFLAQNMFKIVYMLGFVDKDKNVIADLNTGVIMKNAGSLLGGLMLPGGTKKFMFLLDLVPFLNKYKHLMK